MPWLMAKLYDRFMRPSEQACLTGWRADLLHGLAGDVLEIGAGTGLNLAHYPPAVRRLMLAEPDPHMRQRLQRRLRERQESATALGAVVTAAALEELDSRAPKFDAVVVTLVLCSVPDASVALRQILSLLHPGGRLVFLEHVAAQVEERRYRWQRRLEPLWRRLAGNCHLTRRTEAEICAAGFEIEWIAREPMKGSVPILHDTVRGVARRPLPRAVLT